MSDAVRGGREFRKEGVPHDQIDTTEISEILDWPDAKRGNLGPVDPLKGGEGQHGEATARRGGAPGANGRRAGHSSRGGRAAGASGGGAALHGGLPAPPGAGAAGAEAECSLQKHIAERGLAVRGGREFRKEGVAESHCSIQSLRSR